MITIKLTEKTVLRKIKQLVGRRVRLRTDVDRFPDFIAWEGSTGTIQPIEPHSPISVQMDERIEGCEQWENCVLWNEENMQYFFQEIELIN